MNESYSPNGAHDVAQYMTLWISRKDPDFSKKLVGMPVSQAILLIDERYKTDFSNRTVTAAELLYDLAVAIDGYLKKETA